MIIMDKELKYCKYKSKFANQDDELATGVLIEYEQDVQLYTDIMHYYGSRIIKKFLRSGVPPEKFDHIICGFKPQEQIIGSLAYTHAVVHGDKNPIEEVDPVVNQYINSLKKAVLNGDRVVINENGGINPISNDLFEIVEVNKQKWKTDNRNGYYINKPIAIAGEKTKVINLENDYFLEDRAVKYMKKVLKDENFSYIKELSLFDKEELEEIFKEFLEADGHTVYVYTTGQNVNQMYDYSQAALNAGLKHFLFDFNTGRNEYIDQFINWLNEKANVEIVDYETDMRKRLNDHKK